jgi:hypothetical protein
LGEDLLYSSKPTLGCAGAISLIVAIVALVRVRALRKELEAEADDGRPVVLVRTRPPLPREDLRRILAGWEDTDPRRMALQDVMDMIFGEMLRDVTRRGIDAGERDYSAGAVEALRFLDAKLRELGEPEKEPRGPEGPE